MGKEKAKVYGFGAGNLCDICGEALAIGECERCNQFYCKNCTDAKEWHRFCGEECQDEFHRLHKGE